MKQETPETADYRGSDLARKMPAATPGAPTTTEPSFPHHEFARHYDREDSY
jgi:hypothetical protein